MRKTTIFTALLSAVLLSGCCCGKCCPKKTAEEKKMDMQSVCQFVKEAGVYYIATCDKDQPRVRPFGTIHIFEGKLYIQTGKKKSVAKQIAANPKVELCAFKDGKWLRLSGTLVNDNRREAKASMLDAYPSLKKMYSADDDNTLVLYFKDATATLSSFSADPVSCRF